jgi:hypothetical protein
MTQLVSYYKDKPVDLKGKVEIAQHPIASSTQFRSSEGAVQPGAVYVVVPSTVTRGLLVPFGAYDEWSLRDRYNEAIRIMNTLGASTIVCESYRAVIKRSGLRLLIRGKGPDVTFQRVENSGFDFRHTGAGSVPRDPSPLRWPDEPGFAAAVVSVLGNKANQVSLNIRSNNNFSADGSLGIRLKQLGFELGGGHTHTGIASLHITAQFPVPTRKGWP